MGLCFSRSSLTDELGGARSGPGPLPATQPRCAVRVLTSSPGARAGEAGARFRAWRSCSRYVALRCQDLPAKPGWCFLCAARPDVCSS